MGKRRLSDDQVKYVVDSYRDKRSIIDVARELQVCVDTVRKALATEGVVAYTGGKYNAATVTKTWNRPCLLCKATDTRPKWQYVCTPCKNSQRSTTDAF